MGAIDPESIVAITFDCYGTLIDWEAGITRAVGEVLARHGVSMGRAELLEAYAEFEREAEAGAYRSYREILGDVMRAFGARAGVSLSAGEVDSLAGSIAEWPAHADTVDALRALKRRYKLGVLSNIDRDLFAGTLVRLGVELDLLVTAQDVRSYKPGRAHFDEALQRLGEPVERVLHVAESRFHDVGPAGELGFPTVWVNRAGGGPAASGESDARADAVVGDLRELVALLGAGAA